jgi:hypothetical protein
VNQVLTLVVRLQLSTEQQKVIAVTAESFASACNTINRTVNPKLTNRNSIQAVCYHGIKKESGLTANHVIRACARGNCSPQLRCGIANETN